MSQDDLTDLQRAIHGQGYGWQAGSTSLSALSPQDQARRLGLRLAPGEMRRIALRIVETAPEAEFPGRWDWRDVGGTDWTTPIRDQMACGSCVAFGVVAVMEAMFKLHMGDPALKPDFSEAHLFFCGCGACCDKGWWPSYALNYAQYSGVADEACLPYEGRNLECSEACAEWPDRAIRVSGWQEIIPPGARKEWLATRGPMAGCMAVYRDFFSYVSGVYRHVQGELAGYHAVCVVGYAEDERAWLCKNSWGPGWGESGWFKISYGECGIDTQFAMYGVEAVVPPDQEPPPPPPPQPGCNLWARAVSALQRLGQRQGAT